MKVEIITIFPDMFQAIFEYGIIKRAIDKGIIKIICIDLRDFTKDKHRTVDDRPFGGGEGMVFKPEPLAAAIRSIKVSEKTKIIYLSPQGVVLNQQKAKELSKLEHMILICGRYEGIDQRIIDLFVDEEISIGDYILSGGEIPAMVLVDTVTRLLPGAVGHPQSTENESFENSLLEGPVYTRPADFEGHKVPQVLLSGNHKEIARWKKEKALDLT